MRRSRRIPRGAAAMQSAAAALRRESPDTPARRGHRWASHTCTIAMPLTRDGSAGRPVPPRPRAALRAALRGAQLLGDPAQRRDAALDLGAAGCVAFLHRLDELAGGTGRRLVAVVGWLAIALLTG